MDLLKVTDNDIQKVRESYGISEKRIKEDVTLIKEWYRKQQHLPQGLDDENLIERMLLGSKFRIEVTKEKLDSYYTVKTVYKDLFENLEKLRPSKLVTVYLPLPLLTPTQERLVLIKVRDMKNLDFDLFMKSIMAIGEIMLNFDYPRGVRTIVDMKNIKLEHITKVNSSLLQKTTSASQDALASRILGIECFNAPGYISGLIAILKRVMKPKVFDRIKIHDNLESLYTVVPKECLPGDLGGDLENSEKLLERWDKEFKAKTQFFQQVAQRKSNEKLRIGKSKYSTGTFGAEGTFRKLDLD